MHFFSRDLKLPLSNMPLHLHVQRSLLKPIKQVELPMDPHPSGLAREKPILLRQSMDRLAKRRKLKVKSLKLLRAASLVLSSDIGSRVLSRCRNASERTMPKIKSSWVSSRKIPNGQRKRFSNCMSALDSRRVKSTSGTGICSASRATTVKMQTVTMTTQGSTASQLRSTRVVLTSLMAQKSWASRVMNSTKKCKTCQNAKKLTEEAYPN